MHVGHALGQSLPQGLVNNLPQEGGDVLGLRVQEPVRLRVGRCVGQQVDRSQPRLLPARHKHNYRLPWGVCDDGVVGGLCHLDNPRGVVGHVEALHLQLERDWTNVGVEVEGAVSGAAKPLSNVLAIAKRGGEGEDPDGALKLAGDVPHPGADHLQYWPVVSSKQLQFINNEKVNVLHILSLLPPPA